MKLEVGIDLGTTNTVVAYIKNGSVEYLKFRNLDNISSTLLYQTGKVTIGEVAKKKAAICPENYIKSSKSSMGDNNKKWHIEDRVFSPTDVASEILKEIYKTIRKAMPEISEVEAVITVPAYFTSSQIEETKKAGDKAGLNVKKIITEPVSAAVAYGFEESINQKLFIIDIGGGTFDTAILEVKNGSYETLAINGDSKLGGDDFDTCILDIFLKHIRKDAGKNLSSHSKSGLEEDEYMKAYQALLNKAEEVKIDLSDYESVDIDIANIFSGYNFSTTITRQQFEESSAILINKIKRTIEQTLDDKELSASNIDKIVLVGGSSKIPVIREFVTGLFAKMPYADKPLDKLVAMGAAIYAHSGNSVQIDDIISHSLGIELVNERFSKIIHKNSKYPISRSDTYTTVRNFQEKIDINIYEGEDGNNVNNNFRYGGFTLSDIEKAPAGMPKVEVIFSFDENRILTVIAKDKATNSSKSEKIEINKLSVEA